MMTNSPAEATLMDAVCSNPADDAPRLAYADWVEHNAGGEGGVRADYIRRQIRAFRMDHQISDTTTVEIATPARKAAWSNGDDALGVRWYQFVRGFVAYVRTDATTLMRIGKELVTRCPIEYLGVDRGAKDCLSALLHAPWMQQVFAIDLGGNDLDDADLRLIATSGLDLRYLGIDGNPVTEQGIEALAAATAAGKFPELHTVLTDLPILDTTEGGGFAMDPVPRVVGYSELGARLRQTYGDLAWLNSGQQRTLLFA
jgi:uncharacterized protein (TIGR02996 family)